MDINFPLGRSFCSGTTPDCSLPSQNCQSAVLWSALLLMGRERSDLIGRDRSQTQSTDWLCTPLIQVCFQMCCRCAACLWSCNYQKSVATPCALAPHPSDGAMIHRSRELVSIYARWTEKKKWHTGHRHLRKVSTVLKSAQVFQSSYVEDILKQPLQKLHGQCVNAPIICVKTPSMECLFITLEM